MGSGGQRKEPQCCMASANRRKVCRRNDSTFDAVRVRGRERKGREEREPTEAYQDG